MDNTSVAWAALRCRRQLSLLTPFAAPLLTGAANRGQFGDE